MIFAILLNFSRDHIEEQLWFEVLRELMAKSKEYGIMQSGINWR